MKLLKKDIVESVSALGALPFFLIMICILCLLNQVSFALQLLLGIIIAHIVTYFIRLIYYKERPRPQKHSSLIEKIDASSFPSLHSMRAMTFSVISVFHIQSWFAVILFSLYLIGILLSRHYLKKHYVTDIMAGTIIGFLIGLLAMWLIPLIY